jgi:alpha-tubulin suppressor-like RCC1 family protein
VPAKAGLCLVVVTAAVAAGCSSGPGPAATTATATSTVMHWGSFFGGPVGNFDTRTAPVKVKVPGSVVEVATSNSTEYALLSDGSVYAWGLGTQGELGNGRLRNSFDNPVRVDFPAGVKIAFLPTDVMPYDTGLAVDTKGRAWGWGRNGGGELCRGSIREYSRPVRLPMTHVSTLAGASGHALYDSNGTVYACGTNLKGALGDGSRRDSSTPVRVAALNGAKVTELVASFANSGALLSDGEYYDWGYDGDGQLGDGRVRTSSDVPVRVFFRHPVAQVALGGSIWNNGQTLVMLSDGALYSWGNDRAGQLGDQKNARRPVPHRFYPPAGVTYKSLATGSATSYGLSTDGEVYAWGVSHVGQVGDGSTSTAVSAVVVASGAASISATANNVVISLP